MPRMMINTCAEMIRIGYTLTAYCERAGCRHHHDFDLHALGARIGMSTSTLRDDLVPRLRCSKCGGKELSLRIGTSDGDHPCA